MKTLFTKIISLALGLILILSIICACDNTPLNEENCENGHNLVQSSYTAPTCKTNGQRAFKCSRCEYTETETLLSINHDYRELSATPSTCTSHGSKTFECSMCHESKNETLPLLDHDYELISETPSTCTVKGVKTYECKDCDDIYSAELDLLPHTLETKNTATCFVNGELKNVCRECGYEEVLAEVDMFTHDFGEDRYCVKCGIYETLIDEDDLNVKHKIKRSAPWFDITGNLTPKFNTENSIPYTYFVDHQISLTTYLYNENEELLDYITTKSTINTWQGDYQNTMTLQYGGFLNGCANQFRLNYTPHYADIKVFSKEMIESAHSFKIVISCEGYKSVEKAFNITEEQ